MKVAGTTIVTRRKADVKPYACRIRIQSPFCGPRSLFCMREDGQGRGGRWARGASLRWRESRGSAWGAYPQYPLRPLADPPPGLPGRRSQSRRMPADHASTAGVGRCQNDHRGETGWIPRGSKTTTRRDSSCARSRSTLGLRPEARGSRVQLRPARAQ